MGTSKISKSYKRSDFRCCFLSAENKKNYLFLQGFLHGFATLENDTIVFYKCDNYYNKDAEDGV